MMLEEVEDSRNVVKERLSKKGKKKDEMEEKKGKSSASFLSFGTACNEMLVMRM